MEVFMGNHRYHMDPYSGAESREWGKWSMKIIPFPHSLPSTGKGFFLTIVVDSALANLKYWSWVEHIVCNTGWWLSPTPLKNDGVRQLGLLFPINMESHKNSMVPVTTNQNSLSESFRWPQLNLPSGRHILGVYGYQLFVAPSLQFLEVFQYKVPLLGS